MERVFCTYAGPVEGTEKAQLTRLFVDRGIPILPDYLSSVFVPAHWIPETMRIGDYVFVGRGIFLEPDFAAA